MDKTELRKKISQSNLNQKEKDSLFLKLDTGKTAEVVNHFSPKKVKKEETKKDAKPWSPSDNKKATFSDGK